MKRALIFDFGGVIMKTRDYGPRHSWDARLGLSPGSVEAIVHGSDAWRQAQTGALSVMAYWQTVANALNLSPADGDQLAQDFFSGDQVDQGVISAIQHWRETGHRIALLSNDSLTLAVKLDRLDLTTLFDHIVISAQIGVMKPDAAAYRAVLDALQRPAAACIFVDDMPANVRGAAALGIQAVHYVDGMDLRAELAPLLIMEED